MKKYLVLNISERVTKWFFATDLTTAHKNFRKLNWLESDSVILVYNGFEYRPIISSSSTTILCIECHTFMSNYLQRYAHAISCLPVNFDKTIKFEQCLL